MNNLDETCSTVALSNMLIGTFVGIVLVKFYDYVTNKYDKTSDAIDSYGKTYAEKISDAGTSVSGAFGNIKETIDKVAPEGSGISNMLGNVDSMFKAGIQKAEQKEKLVLEIHENLLKVMDNLGIEPVSGVKESEVPIESGPGTDAGNGSGPEETEHENSRPLDTEETSDVQKDVEEAPQKMPENVGKTSNVINHNLSSESLRSRGNIPEPGSTESAAPKEGIKKHPDVPNNPFMFNEEQFNFANDMAKRMMGEDSVPKDLNFEKFSQMIGQASQSMSQEQSNQSVPKPTTNVKGNSGKSMIDMLKEKN